jgi:hypothetical protein
MIREQAEALLDSTLEIRIENEKTTKISIHISSSLAVEPFIVANHEEEEKEKVEQQEQIEPSNLSNDKEVSTKVHSFFTIPLEIQHEPQASSFQCFEEPSYVEIFKESCPETCKSRNSHPKKIF